MILQVRSLTVSIGSHKVCCNLNLDLIPSSRLAILGRNGVGKSTLLATLVGLRAPDTGSILLTGQTYKQLGLRKSAQLRGLLSQERSDAFTSNVLETVLTGRHPHISRWTWESEQDIIFARSALADVGLSEISQRYIHTLSGGERQRVAIATLLAQQPLLYLLDEPLAHLDLNHQIAVMQLLTKRVAIEQSKAMVMVLHDPNFALRYCDLALLLFDDHHHIIGPVEEVLTAPILSNLFSYPLRRVEDFFIPE